MNNSYIKLKYKIFIIGLLLTIIRCSQSTSNKSIDESVCEEHYNSANQKLNQYYLNNDKYNLDSALVILNNAHDLCPNYNVRFTNLKLTILTLLENGESGLNFVNTLDSSNFNKPYQKQLYISTFKCLLLKKKNDTLSINKEYEALSLEIEKYYKNNISDKEAFYDLYISKMKYLGKDSVIKELNSLNHVRFDKDFINSIKETLLNMPEAF